MNERLGKTIEAEDDEISMLDLLQVVADNLRLLVIGPLAAGLLAFGYTFTITPTFTATTKFIAPQQHQSGAASLLAGLGALGSLAGAVGSIKNPANQYVAFLKSNSLQDALVDRFLVMERLETQSREAARNAINGSVQIASGKDGLITIDASDKDPVFAAKLANAHVEELGKLLNLLAITEAQQRRVFFEKQLNNAKDNLVNAEQALATTGINRSVLKSTGAAVAAMAQLKGQIAAQEINLASMRGYLTESAPDFKQAQMLLSAMRGQMSLAERAEPTIVGTSTGNSDYIAKYRDFKYAEALFEIFTKQYEIARIDESREGAVIQVLDPAQPPELESKPKRAMIAVQTTFMSSAVLLVLLFSRYALRRAAQRPETAEKLSRLHQALRVALGFRLMPKKKPSTPFLSE